MAFKLSKLNFAWLTQNNDWIIPESWFWFEDHWNIWQKEQTTLLRKLMQKNLFLHFSVIDEKSFLLSCLTTCNSKCSQKVWRKGNQRRQAFLANFLQSSEMWCNNKNAIDDFAQSLWLCVQISWNSWWEQWKSIDGKSSQTSFGVKQSHTWKSHCMTNCVKKIWWQIARKKQWNPTDIWWDFVHNFISTCHSKHQSSTRFVGIFNQMINMSCFVTENKEWDALVMKMAEWLEVPSPLKKMHQLKRTPPKKLTLEQLFDHHTRVFASALSSSCTTWHCTSHHTDTAVSSIRFIFRGIFQMKVTFTQLIAEAITTWQSLARLSAWKWVRQMAKVKLSNALLAMIVNWMTAVFLVLWCSRQICQEIIILDMTSFKGQKIRDSELIRMENVFIVRVSTKMVLAETRKQQRRDVHGIVLFAEQQSKCAWAWCVHVLSHKEINFKNHWWWCHQWSPIKPLAGLQINHNSLHSLGESRVLQWPSSTAARAMHAVKWETRESLWETPGVPNIFWMCGVRFTSHTWQQSDCKSASS